MYRLEGQELIAKIKTLTGKAVEELDAEQIYAIMLLIKQGRRLRSNAALRNYLVAGFKHATIREVPKVGRFGKPYKAIKITTPESSVEEDGEDDEAEG